MNFANRQFRRDLESLLNRYSIDTLCSTPDYILAGLLVGHLEAYRVSREELMKHHGAQGMIVALNKAKISRHLLFAMSPNDAIHYAEIHDLKDWTEVKSKKTIDSLRHPLSEYQLHAVKELMEGGVIHEALVYAQLKRETGF